MPRERGRHQRLGVWPKITLRVAALREKTGDLSNRFRRQGTRRSGRAVVRSKCLKLQKTIDRRRRGVAVVDSTKTLEKELAII